MYCWLHHTSLHGFAYFVGIVLCTERMKLESILNFSLVCLHPPSSIRITQCWFVHFFLSHNILHRYKSSKVEPSLVKDIKIAAGFNGVRQYVGWLIFMYKSYIENYVWREGGRGKGVGLWKTSQWRFPFQNWFTSDPLPKVVALLSKT